MIDVQERVAISYLTDFYAPLLTPHRQEVLRLFCEEDMSLAEIAEEMGITRQGVSDALNKARKQMEEYESLLGLAERYRILGQQARKCRDALEQVAVTEESRPALEAAKAALEEILQER